MFSQFFNIFWLEMYDSRGSAPRQLTGIGLLAGWVGLDGGCNGLDSIPSYRRLLSMVV